MKRRSTHIQTSNLDLRRLSMAIYDEHGRNIGDVRYPSGHPFYKFIMFLFAVGATIYFLSAGSKASRTCSNMLLRQHRLEQRRLIAYGTNTMVSIPSSPRGRDHPSLQTLAVTRLQRPGVFQVEVASPSDLR